LPTKHNNFIIPEARTLEKAFTNSAWTSMVLLWLVMIIDTGILYLLFTSNDKYLAILTIAAIILALSNIKDDYWAFFKQEKEDLDTTKEDTIGNYKVVEIREIVDSVFANFKGKEIPKVYIIDEPTGGPMVIDTYVFNFLGPLNAIYIPRHVFGVYKPNELKAIIAHELGHFYHYMYPIQRFPYPFYLLATLVPLITFPLVNIWVAIAILVVFSFLFHPLLYKAFNHKSKRMEYLCDLFAAKLFGKLNIINGLIVTCKYSELVELTQKKVLKNIKVDDTLSVENYGDIFDQILRVMPKQPSSRDELDSVITEVISNFDHKSYKTKLSKTAIKKEHALISVMLTDPFYSKKREVLDWSTFDFIKRNHRIEPGEYTALIQTILDKKSYLIDSVTDEDDDELSSTHPSIRSRILCLDKNID
jgi:Zn-dependent protease with chaperone function